TLIIEEQAKNKVNTDGRAPAVTHHPRAKRYYIDVAIGSECLSGADTGGAYCLIEASLAPGILVPRHLHTRQDEWYYVRRGALQVFVGADVLLLKPGDCLMAPRNIPQQLRNSGQTENHYRLMFSPSGFEEFVMATPLLAPDNAVAPTER